MKKLLRDPLLHFLVLGGLLFGLTAWRGRSPSNGTQTISDQEIVITPGMMENLKVSFERTNGHPPSESDLPAMIEAYVHEEVLVREARALGLDRDDMVVRLRLVQRMEFLSEEEADLGDPDDATLQHFIDENPQRFQKPDGSAGSLATQRPKALRLWQESQREKTVQAAYEKLRQKYQVRLPDAPGKTS